jgi:hypothetical protein
MNYTNILKSLLVAPLLLSTLTHAEFKNNSYSYLGLGSETLTYSETDDNFGGQSFKSHFSGTNLVQKSGGYTAIGEQYGFFISTSSTLLMNEGKEEWDFEGIGVAQEDTMTLKRTGIDLLGAYHLQNGHFFNTGLHYSSASFSRFEFTSTDQTDDLNDAIFSNPNVQADLQKDLNTRLTDINKLRETNPTACIGDPSKKNACLGTIDTNSNQQVVTVEEYWEIRKFAPEETQSVVFEEMTSWSALIGWGYDSYFIDQSLGMRYKLAARFGSALYEDVLNTENNKSLTRTFGGDWNAHLLAGIGYQFQKEIGVVFTVELNGAHRSKLQLGNENVFLPDNTLWAFSPQLAGFWSF